MSKEDSILVEAVDISGKEHIQKLMNLLNARLGSGKVIIVATNGNPSFVVKPVVFNQEGQEVSE